MHVLNMYFWTNLKSFELRVACILHAIDAITVYVYNLLNVGRVILHLCFLHGLIGGF